MYSRLKENKVIGIIGLGKMGYLVAKKLSQDGWKVVACDLEEKYLYYKKKFENEKFQVVFNGIDVSQISDYIVYSVEINNIEDAVSKFIKSTKTNAIVGGQLSVKIKEIKTFEKHINQNTDLISFHLMHGPDFDTKGHNLIIIKHKTNKTNDFFFEKLISSFECKKIYLSAKQHDKIVANTQAFIHTIFFSIGIALRTLESNIPKDITCLENLLNPINTIFFRIHKNNWSMYANISLQNPFVYKLIHQYTKSFKKLYHLINEKKTHQLHRIIKTANDFIFDNVDKNNLKSKLKNNSLSKKTSDDLIHPFLSLFLFATIDCWNIMKIKPFEHLECSTPLYEAFLSVILEVSSSFAFFNSKSDPNLHLNHVMKADYNFLIAVQISENIIYNQDFISYKSEFEKNQNFIDSLRHQN